MFKVNPTIKLTDLFKSKPTLKCSNRKGWYIVNDLQRTFENKISANTYKKQTQVYLQTQDAQIAQIDLNSELQDWEIVLLKLVQH